MLCHRSGTQQLPAEDAGQLASATARERYGAGALGLHEGHVGQVDLSAVLAHQASALDAIAASGADPQAECRASHVPSMIPATITMRSPLERRGEVGPRAEGAGLRLVALLDVTRPIRGRDLLSAGAAQLVGNALRPKVLALAWRDRPFWLRAELLGPFQEDFLRQLQRGKRENQVSVRPMVRAGTKKEVVGRNPAGEGSCFQVNESQGDYRVSQAPGPVCASPVERERIQRLHATPF